MKAGTKVLLNGKLFCNSQTHCGKDRIGVWYLYDEKVVNGRYRVTNVISRVGKEPISVNVSGYVNVDDVIPL